MPMSYRILPEERLVLTVGEGVLTDSDILRHKERLSADPDFDPDMDELSDVRSIAELGVTPAGLRLFTAFDERHSGGAAGRRLAIVASEDLVLNMARAYQNSGGNRGRVGVFRTMKEARAWLDSGDEPRASDGR